MTVNAKVSVFDLVEEANKVIDTVPVGDAIAMHGDPDVVFVDLRDVRELEREGRIPGGVPHAARDGGVSGWIRRARTSSPRSSAPTGGSRSTATGDWRSALATEVAQRIGLERACHIEGGYTAWKEAGGPTEACEAQARMTRRTGS